LADGTGGGEYLDILQRELPPLLDAIRPDIVFYLAGVDVLATDKYGKLGLSQRDCLERDMVVFRECKRRGLPVAVSMGGGYSADIKHIVDAHVGTYRVGL
jgi:acetoin utilization deacetylase AcuC-like enzyme